MIMRSEGHVRYLRISSRLQMAVAAIIAGLLLAWVLTMAAVAVNSLLERHTNILLLNREAKVTKAESKASTPQIEACVVKAVTSSTPPMDGTCAATIDFSK